MWCGSSPVERMSRLLNHKEDVRSVVFVCITLLLLLMPFVVDIKAAWVLPWLLAASLFCFSSCIINHNHVHNSTFRDARINILFGLLLTLAKGHSSAGVILAHNYNHHVHNGDDNDWIRPQLAGAGRGFVRLLRFVIAAVGSMARGRRTTSPKLLPAATQKHLRRERGVLWVFVAALLMLDVGTFLLFVAIPWAVGVILLIGVNLLQHDGCRPGSRYHHSRNFTGRTGNWFFFNNGYHTAHHMQPELHWSRLPHWHREHVAPAIDNTLEQRSILSYLFNNYLLAGPSSQGEKQ